jgi:predicted ester cyclase
MFGVAAAGQSVDVAGMTIYEIEEGAVQREEGLVDNLALMQQLGLKPGRPDEEENS